MNVRAPDDRDLFGTPGDVAAIVLAAGEGRRMGIAKALLTLDGVTLVERHVARLVEIGCAPVIVVLRPDVAGALRPRIERERAAHVLAARTTSQAASLVAGARALGAWLSDEHAEEHEREAGRGALTSLRSILVSPVDIMPPSPGTVRALRDALVPPLAAATPTHRGRGGHPILVRPEVLARLVRADATASAGAELPSLRDVLEGLAERRVRVDVDDPRVLGDFDAPAELPASLDAPRRSA